MEKLGLNEMIVALRRELLLAQQNGQKEDLRFKVEDIDVEVDVATTKEGEGIGSVKFWVYNAGLKAKLGEVRTQKLRLRLKPLTSVGDLEISDEDEK